MTHKPPDRLSDTDMQIATESTADASKPYWYPELVAECRRAREAEAALEAITTIANSRCAEAEARAERITDIRDAIRTQLDEARLGMENWFEAAGKFRDERDEARADAGGWKRKYFTEGSALVTENRALSARCARLTGALREMVEVMTENVLGKGPPAYRIIVSQERYHRARAALRDDPGEGKEGGSNG